MEKECYEEEVQHYRKTDDKPIIYIYIYSEELRKLISKLSLEVVGCDDMEM